MSEISLSIRFGTAVGALALAASQIGCGVLPTRPEAPPTNTVSTLVIKPPTLTPFYTPTLTSTMTETETATPTATPTETETATPAPFETFIQTVEHLDKNEYLGGIYVEGLLALKLKAGGGDGITKQNNEATIVAGADTVIIFAHDNIEGSKFWLLSGKTVYYIKSDGTWGEYKVNNQTNFYDIDGKKQVFSKKPYPYEQPYLTTDNLEAQYYPKGKPEGEMNPTTIVFQTCLSDIAPEGYKTPGEITDTGVQFTTAGASDDTTLPAP